MEPSPSSSVELRLARARSGNADDRDQLFADCRDYLRFVARAQLESSLAAKVDASDVVQETLLEAYRDFARFQGHTQAEWLAWLRRILAHNVADVIRRYRLTAKRRTGREVSLGQPAAGQSTSFLPADPPARDESPSQQVMRHERQLLLAAALAQLPADYRDVIVLRNLRRLSFDEVAAELHRSRPAAQMLWARAMKKLGVLLQAENSLTDSYSTSTPTALHTQPPHPTPPPKQ